MSKRAKERRRTVADLPVAELGGLCPLANKPCAVGPVDGRCCVYRTPYEPPVVTPIANLRDLLASVCAPHDEDA